MLIPAKASGAPKRRPVGMAGASSAPSSAASTSSSPRSSFSSTHSASSSRSSSPTSSPRFRELDLPLPPPPYYEYATSAVPCRCQGGLEARCGSCVERQVETVSLSKAGMSTLVNSLLTRACLFRRWHTSRQCKTLSTGWPTWSSTTSSTRCAALDTVLASPHATRQLSRSRARRMSQSCLFFRSQRRRKRRSYRAHHVIHRQQPASLMGTNISILDYSSRIWAL